MSFDDMGMSGRGTLKEYFLHEGSDDPFDGHVDRLQFELFTKLSGLEPDEIVEVFWPDEDYPWIEDEREAMKFAKATMKDLRAKAKQPGLVLLGVQPDDPILGLFKNGKPVAAFYASYRGVYQAGGYVEKGDQHFFAHDAFKEEFAGPMNVWMEHQSGCSEIARDFLLGKRTY